MDYKEHLQFWDDRAKLGDLAGSNDFGIKNFEMDTLQKYIKDDMSILDIGCGSGTSAFYFASKNNIDITGLDFSSKMIEQAKIDLEKKKFDNAKMRFFVEDIKNISNSQNISGKQYDLVMTERVIINLASWDEQRKAITDIMKYVKPGGYYLMCENLQEGLDNLNNLRKKMNLGLIDKPWHNRYLSIDEMNNLDGIDIEDCIDFSSTYYFFSRIINAELASRKNEQPSYDSPINELAFNLKNYVDLSALNIGQTRLWVIKNS